MAFPALPTVPLSDEGMPSALSHQRRSLTAMPFPRADFRSGLPCSTGGLLLRGFRPLATPMRLESPRSFHRWMPGLRVSVSRTGLTPFWFPEVFGLSPVSSRQILEAFGLSPNGSIGRAVSPADPQLCWPFWARNRLKARCLSMVPNASLIGSLPSSRGNGSRSRGFSATPTTGFHNYSADIIHGGKHRFRRPQISAPYGMVDVYRVAGADGADAGWGGLPKGVIRSLCEHRGSLPRSVDCL